ncbi:Tbingi protein [Rhizophagus irregularis DAOM 181602=DAOM 197198]|uniref:Uncharacterized protein n=1 Tax=Rhizophagus irregularis (strain DAOM 197198w) TaxID=1432141 RepID=A0A015JDQ8_RHIIW|nr:hypothetical protein RirG_136400 [Rhizophagus irregularis DAOM 197198w]GBC39632.2 Tbingi protein [Rhizophagus irregularis DAOM 181602=DAOM 197198]
MVDINLIYHDRPLNTWNRSDKKSRIDYMWVTEDLVPDTIYASTNKVHIFETDHSAVTIYFQIDDLFHTKQLFKKKKHNNNNLKVNYKKIDNQLWETYEKKIEKLLDKEKDIIDSVEISINNINRIWNTIRDTFKKANSVLPKKKGNLNKEVLPKTIVFYKRFLHKLSYILTNLMEKKIMSLNLINYRECKKFIEKHYETITEICLKFAIDIDGLLDKNINEFKEIVKIAFKLVQYNEIIQPISESEWDHMIRQLANDKAPGISQISNEMLKHMGTLMKSVMLKLANLCLQVGDIPEEWRHTLLLSKVIAERNILKGGNHAGLPGGSTEAPLRIINTCIEDAKKNNRVMVDFSRPL